MRRHLGDGHRRRRCTRAQVYLYHVVDNEQTWKDDGAQAVVWQTAINPVIGLELLANGTWSGTGVLGPEAFDAVPFMDLLNDHGSPWGMTEMLVTRVRRGRRARPAARRRLGRSSRRAGL